MDDRVSQHAIIAIHKGLEAQHHSWKDRKKENGQHGPKAARCEPLGRLVSSFRQGGKIHLSPMCHRLHLAATESGIRAS